MVGGRPKPRGFQKPLSQPGKKKVGVARISYDGDFVVCSCGWAYGALREKVREDAVDRHIEKKHQGKGFRL